MRRCPACRKSFAPRPRDEDPAFPFCSERCKMVDLGRWMREEYRISRPVIDEEDLALEPEPPPEDPGQA